MENPVMQSLNRDVEMLRNIPLFAGLPTPRLKLIAYTAEVVQFEPGEMIVHQGDPADAVYIVAEGEAEIWLTAPSGHVVQLLTVGRHSLLGEVSVLSSGRRTATVQAKDRVVTLKIQAQVFLELLQQSPEIGMQVMRILAERLERSTVLLQQHAHECI
jgi:CRP/FNR family cyclic AMP-dependent transcriptional regulator